MTTSFDDKPALFPIPEGTARLRHPRDLAVIHTRPYTNVMLALGPDRVASMMTSQAAQQAQDSGVNDAEAFSRMASELGLSLREVELVNQMTDAVIWKWMAGWTARRPFPRTMDEVPLMDEATYQACATACSKREAEWRASQKEDPYLVGESTADDPTSPTGSSAD